MNLSFIISVRRAMLGMSRKDLADATGLSYVYVCSLEKDERTPKWETLDKIAGGLKFASVLHMMQWEQRLNEFIKENV